MGPVELSPRIVRAPEFPPGEWLNSRPLSLSQLRGSPILIDFWDYSCVNCLRTLPYLTRWHDQYADRGLQIIGVHTPEFDFGHLREQVANAAAENNLLYPILLDNQGETWSRFANKAWPTKYLIDSSGYIRLQRQGEGHYQEVELAIQQLLRQRSPAFTPPDPLPPLREEDAPGAICYQPTRELHAGYLGGGLHGGALGNPEGYLPQSPVVYALPGERVEGRFYLEGAWQAQAQSMVFAGHEGGRAVLSYAARSVNAVLSPHADPVAADRDRTAELPESMLLVRQNGAFLTAVNAGADVRFGPDGSSYVLVDRPRMVRLVRNPVLAAHELALTFLTGGTALYSFTFTTCVTASPESRGRDTFFAR